MRHSRRLILLLASMALIAGSVMASPPPLGEPNEVWVGIPDTAYVGQELLLQVYMANDAELLGFTTTFVIYSPDGCNWEWVPQDDSLWEFYLGVNIVSPNNDFRIWDYFRFRLGEWGPVDSQSARFNIGGLSIDPPHGPAGPLAHAYSIHLRPVNTGTICIDSSFFPPAAEQWIFHLLNSTILPAWNGPFCFTVVEPVLGDVNCDGVANIGDAVYLINWIFRGGPPPCR